jgi:hypothetical protein
LVPREVGKQKVQKKPTLLLFSNSPREVGKQKVKKKPSCSFQIQVHLLKMDMVDAPNSKDEGMVIPHQNSNVT